MKVISESEKLQVYELVEDLINHGFKGAVNTVHGHHNFYSWEEMYHDYLCRIHCVAVCGVTRVVIVPDWLDWVVKVNFMGSGITQNYNALEDQHFQLAVEAGLDRYFAATYFIDKVEGIEVYAQEKVKVDEESVSSSFFEYTLENYYRQAREEEDEDAVNEAAWEESIGLENEDRIYAMIEDGGAEELVNFVFENDINDLHSGNWGYRGDEPVLIDYAGY